MTPSTPEGARPSSITKLKTMPRPLSQVPLHLRVVPLGHSASTHSGLGGAAETDAAGITSAEAAAIGGAAASASASSSSERSLRFLHAPRTTTITIIIAKATTVLVLART